MSLSNKDARRLDERLEAAAAAYKAMSPVDRALHDADQRRSFIRGQAGFEPPRDVLADEVRRLRAELAKSQAAHQAAEAQVAEMREALNKARAQFHRYALMHKEKGTAEGDAKALTNAAYAEMCARSASIGKEGGDE